MLSEHDANIKAWNGIVSIIMLSIYVHPMYASRCQHYMTGGATTGKFSSQAQPIPKDFSCINGRFYVGIDSDSRVWSLVLPCFHDRQSAAYSFVGRVGAVRARHGVPPHLTQKLSQSILIRPILGACNSSLPHHPTPTIHHSPTLMHHTDLLTPTLTREVGR